MHLVLKQNLACLDIIYEEHTLIQSMSFLSMKRIVLGSSFDLPEMGTSPSVANKQLNPRPIVPNELWSSLYHKQMVEGLNKSFTFAYTLVYIPVCKKASSGLKAFVYWLF